MKSINGMAGTGNARELAEMLRQLGRGRDTVLAHITPEEAQMLMDMGGSGAMNPDTGLPEFQPYPDPQYDFYGGREYDVESQPGGFYGQTPTAYITSNRVNDLGQQLVTTRLEPNQERALPANVYADISGISGKPPIYTPMTGFAPEYGVRDVEVQPGGFYGGRAPTAEEYAAVYPQAQPGMLERGAQGVEDTARRMRELARQYPTVARLLGTGATTLPSLVNAMRARRDAERSAAQLRELGAPLRQQGEALRQQALAGTLTPQQAQQQEAERARARQAAASRGVTTGTQQAMIENQLARQRAALSETNLNNAIKMLNLANAYDEEAIRTKLSSDQRINAIVGNIFANLGATAAESAGATGTTQEQRPAVTRRPEIPRGNA